METAQPTPAAGPIGGLHGSSRPRPRVALRGGVRCACRYAPAPLLHRARSPFDHPGPARARRRPARGGRGSGRRARLHARRARAAARGAGAHEARADPGGPGRQAPPRRALVLPPGRHLRRRGRGLVRPARPDRLEAGARAEQLERHRPDRGQGQRRLVPQGVQAPQGAEGRPATLEGALRGRELPLDGLAERTPDRQLRRLLPVRARHAEPALRPQHAGGEGVEPALAHRPHALAAGTVQRLRRRRLVELRRDPARGLRAAGRQRGRPGGGRPPPPPLRALRSACGGACPGPQRHLQEAEGRARRPGPRARRLRGARPGQGPDRPRRRPVRGGHARGHRAPAPLAAGPARPLLDGRDRPDRQGRGGGGHVPPQLRRAEVREAARDPLPQREAGAPARREHPRGRPGHGRRAHPGRPRPPSQPPARPGRDGHALALPTAPGVPRSARPGGDPLLVAGAGVPVAQLLLRPAGVPRVGRASGPADGREQPQPPVRVRVVARERAGGRALRARRVRPRPPDIHLRRGRGRARARRHAPDRDRPPVANRRDALEPGLSLPRRPGRERVLRLVRLGARGHAAGTVHDRGARPLPRRPAARQSRARAHDHRIRRRGLRARAPPTSAAPTGSRPATRSRTCASTTRSATWPARSHGRCATSGSSRAGRAERRSPTPLRRGTTRASSRRRTRASRSTSSCASAGGSTRPLG